MKGDLPKGWIEITLSEIGTLFCGQSPAAAEVNNNGKGALYISGPDQWDGHHIQANKWTTSPKRLVPNGCIFVTVKGAGVGTLFAGPACAIGRDIYAFLPMPPISLAFTRYALQHTISEIVEQAAGLIPGLSRDDLMNHSIPFPPLNEQRRIVAKLEKLLGKVDACQKRLEKIPIILKRFRQSVLAAACSGRLTADWRAENPKMGSADGICGKLVKSHECAGGHKRGNAAPPTEGVHDLKGDDLPESWKILNLRELVEPDRPITYGILKPGPDTPDGVLYVRVADFPNDRLNLSTLRRTKKEIDAAYARARLREGDILLSIRGTVGRVCIVPNDLNNANITQDTCRLTIQQAMNASYVAWYLRAPATQNRMQRAIKGVAIRGINIGDVREMQVAIPPTIEQQEIVRRVEALFRFADQIEARYRKAKAQVNKLTQSILAKAFRGELVPQDPDDEPAAVLLERIGNDARP